MKAKMFEIRDAGTFMPMLAVKLTSINEQDGYLLRRAGLNRDSSYKILLYNVNTDSGTMDRYKWPNAPMVRTLPVAHEYIEKHFDELDSGAVIDVQFILGEKDTIKISERYNTEF